MGMIHRPLGQTGLELSPIGLGTVKIGRNTDVKYPTDFELPSDQEIIDLLTLASELGINCLDTAPAYGTSETRLGELLPEITSDFRIITKVGETYDRATGSHYDFSEIAIFESLERSLQRLNRDRLDVVLLHSDGKDMEHLDQGALQTLIKARDRGLIQAVGLSGKTLDGGRQALNQGADCLMITLNPETQAEKPLIDEAQRFGAGLLVKKALGSGYLTASIPDIFQDLFTHPNITSAIIGTINPVHLRNNCLALPTEIQL
jgi:aryl-alcohol dehydrogenase-like predicted oxidoreductase